MACRRARCCAARCPGTRWTGQWPWSPSPSASVVPACPSSSLAASPAHPGFPYTSPPGGHHHCPSTTYVGGMAEGRRLTLTACRWVDSDFWTRGTPFEVSPHCGTLVFDQPTLIRKIQNRSAVVAQFPVFGRRTARLTEPVALLTFSPLRHNSPKSRSTCWISIRSTRGTEVDSPHCSCAGRLVRCGMWEQVQLRWPKVDEIMTKRHPSPRQR